ncbi:MAG: inositol monophosphatase [Patescibacteria group bacterium]
MTKKDKENLIKAAWAGGEVLKKFFGKTLHPKEKSTLWDFQTEADLGSEKTILKILKAKFPKYNINSEEAGKIDNKSEYTLVIDPLDGTNNFVLGIPNFSVSIALFYKNKAVAGVIYQPILNQTYFAEKGAGAFLNNTKIRVNNIANEKKITIAYNCHYQTQRSHLSKTMSNLINSNHKRILLGWSPAYEYCLLASGKIESVVTDDIEIHDYAAGKLIAQEAGAKIIDLTGKKETDHSNSKFIISNNDKINKYILKIIKPLQKGRK